MMLTIGMASYKNRFEVWATVQALRLYHDLADTEIVVVDNAGDDALASWCAGQPVRYVRETAVQGTAYPRDKIFEHARGRFVLVIDSHVMLAAGAVARLRQWCAAHPDCADLLHGPMLYDDLATTVRAMRPQWGGGMWGVWETAPVDPEGGASEIEMHGMGLFACRRDAWLGFARGHRGFGGEEGTIHAKFRRAGRRVLLLSWLRWCHYFKNSGGAQEPVPYRLELEDRVRNYVLGFREAGLELQPLVDQFGAEAVARAQEAAGLPAPRFSAVYYSDLRNPEGVRRYCRQRLEEAVRRAGGEVVEAISTEGTPGHARLYTQILLGLARARTDWIFLCEDDALYPDEHFTGTPGLNSFGYNKSVWHLSAAGYFPTDWPGVFLSTCFGHKEALRQAITRKLEEARAGKLAHAEPEGWECTWSTAVPVLDVRHGGNYTGMREHPEPCGELAGWGEAAGHLGGMGITEAAGKES